MTENEEKIVLPHHEQQTLCTTRLPYRQGRKLTAVKVYTVNDESNHLLIFGVPSLNLRKETKAQFLKFGKLVQFHISTDHPAESFTDTYHAVYEKIQSARAAKRMLDSNNFYGGLLHICYAPELETIAETRHKLFQRHRDVSYRLRNLQNEDEKRETISAELPVNVTGENSKKLLNMGEINMISLGKQIKDVVFNKNKRKQPPIVVIHKKFKPCFEPDDNKNSDMGNRINDLKEIERNREIEAIDCTSIEAETITNINESLNYNKFGNEVIRKIPEKPVNKIMFNVGNKKI